MGHYLQTLRYRVPASLPLFIPMPYGPLGTMGAVIGMRGNMSDAKGVVRHRHQRAAGRAGPGDLLFPCSDSIGPK